MRHKTDYQGEIFKKTAEWISKAEKEILILSATYGKEKTPDVATHSKREEYFKALFKIVMANKKCKDFRYIRINQIARKTHDSLPDSLGIPATQHIKDILKLNAEIQSCQDKPLLSVMTVPMVSLSSVWIIDKKYVITEVCGLDENGQIYPEGRFFFEDHRGDFVNGYVRYFEEISLKSSLLTLAELGT